MDTSSHRRSLLRFSLRDLLWATVVLGVGLGWWLDHSRMLHYRKVLMRLREIGFDAGAAMQMPEVSQEIEAAWERRHAR